MDLLKRETRPWQRGSPEVSPSAGAQHLTIARCALRGASRDCQASQTGKMKMSSVHNEYSAHLVRIADEAETGRYVPSAEFCLKAQHANFRDALLTIRDMPRSRDHPELIAVDMRMIAIFALRSAYRPEPAARNPDLFGELG